MDPDHQFRPWPDLPVELIAIILDHLTFKDHVEFTAVCKKFRDVATKSIHYGSLYLPWLSIAPDFRRTVTWELYSPLERRLRLFPLPLPLPLSMSFISFRGWFLIPHHPNPHLFNPFTLHRIPLPFLFFNHILILIPNTLNVFNSKLVLSSSSPSSPRPQETVAVALHLGFEDLMVCRLGDSGWTCLIDHNNEDNGPAKDALFFDGFLFCLHGRNKVSVYEFDPQLRLKYEIVVPDEVSLIDDPCFLVESAGELLMVVQHMIQPQADGAGDFFLAKPSTVEFDAYKFDSSVPKWEKVNCLVGDVMLFLGENKLTSANVGNLSGFGFRRSCICFYDSGAPAHDGSWFLFCFEDKKITPFSFDALQGLSAPHGSCLMHELVYSPRFVARLKKNFDVMVIFFFGNGSSKVFGAGAQHVMD